jgi:hypothetical protein
MSRLIGKNRVIERDTHFYDEYRDLAKQSAYDNYAAYGETVEILKKIKTPTREISHSGVKGPTGKFGDRRKSAPIKVGNTDTEFKRPENVEYEVGFDAPALIETQPTEQTKNLAGIWENGFFIMRISTRYLEEKDVEINPAEDILLYKGKKYSIMNFFDGMHFLDSDAEKVYTIRSYS